MPMKSHRPGETLHVVCENFCVLLDGLNHVAVMTSDTDRFLAFYRDVFEATHTEIENNPAFRMTIVWIGGGAEINLFQVTGNTEHERQVPMFGRGRLDHLALAAGSIEAFDEIRERLIARGASDGFVTDFGPLLSLFFRDPDGLEAEVCVPNPDARPGVFNPPGTPAARFAT